MRIRLYTLWEQLSGSFWFLPALMVVSAAILALVMNSIDNANPQVAIPLLSWVYTGSPEGARTLLSTIAGSMISVAGVTFSITIATLSLASSQLGPRLLSNFMRDRGNQIVLGTFVSIFTYCLLTLRAIRSEDNSEFVPYLSLTLAMLLAFVSLGVLIFFFHHVSTMIQAQNVVADIGRDLASSIERLFAIQSARTPYEYALRGEEDIPQDFEDDMQFVIVEASGYLQAIDYQALRQVATEHDLLLLLRFRPGDFIAKGSEIIGVHPADRLSQDIEKALQLAFTTGARRLRVQDVEYTIEQLVEIAVRALSPGINDPFTAIACLDQFSTTLADLAERPIPSGYYYDDSGALRVISDRITFSGIINSAFNQIRQHCRSDVAVTIRMLEVIAIITARTRTDAQRDALIRQAEMIKRASDETITEANDLEDIHERYDLIMRMVAAA
ncbi:MAG: DUF2254 domain-containing protein [Chloroflexi bacterium]|nr:DUF2254 domain-containing protein [Chloroflexota bacterium]